MSQEQEKTNKRKIDKLELSRRIRIIQDWILQDHVTTDIIHQSLLQWPGISERQAYRYLWAAKQFFIEKESENLDRKRAYYLARKRKLLRDMNPDEKKTAAGVAAANRVLDSMAKLEGVSTDTFKLIGDPDKPIVSETKVAYSSESIDYTKLPTEFLEQLVRSRTK